MIRDIRVLFDESICLGTEKGSKERCDCNVDSSRSSRWGDRQGKAGTSNLLLAIFYSIFIAYVLIAINIIMFKTIPFSALFHSRPMFLRSINWIPFRTIIEFATSESMDMARAWTNIGGNIAIFVPYGIFIAYAANKSSLRNSFLWLLFTSFSLEIIQYVLALGSSDVDDILLNFTGGAIGIGLYKWFRKKTFSNNRFLTAVIGFFMLAGLLGGVAIRMFDPGLLPFPAASKVSYINENEEVLAGWNEDEVDLFGDLAGAESNEITVYKNPNHMQLTGVNETDEEYVHLQINEATKVFIRHISTNKNTVISKYEERTNFDFAAMLESMGETPTVMVWLSSDNPAVAQAVLVSLSE